MQLRTLALAGAASLLMAAVVHAQPGSSSTPSTGGAPDQSQPASPPSGAVNPPGGAQANPPGVYPSTGSAATTPEVTGAPATGAGATGSTSATSAGTNASVTTTVTTNGPIPDTPENRAKYGGPDSRAGKRTAAKGN